MKQIVTGQDEIVGPWVCGRAGGDWIPGRGKTIGLAENDELLAGVIYEDFNGSNIVMHVAAIPGRRWLCREFLWFCFYYPFVQLGCKRVTGIVPSNNSDARRFDEHLGFILEATLKDAHPQGDLCIYAMHRENCRWLSLKEEAHHGKEQRAVST